MKKRILIVDDDLMIHQLLRHILEFEGYRVDTAKDGVEGVDKAKSFQPDLVLMDYMMPNLDGLAGCKAIKTDPQTKNIPVIILSAHSGVDMPQLAKNAGALLFLDKSSNIPGGLLEVVDELLCGGSENVMSAQLGFYA